MQSTSNPTLTPTTLIFVLGPPASGKGTYCPLLAAHFNYTHLSVGDYLRTLLSSTATDDLRGGMSHADLAQHLATRSAIPASTLMRILTLELAHEQSREARARRGFIIDGFPREIESAELIEGNFSTSAIHVLNFTCSEPTARARFIARARDDSDHQAEIFAERYATYEETKEALLAWFLHKQLSVTTVCTGGDDIASVWGEMVGNLAWMAIGR